MSLTPGQPLSFYEVLDPLGAGGMGEVYRARDTRDTSATRRPLAGFDDDLITESFDIAPDGSRITLSLVEISRELMLAEGVHGILAPRAGR